MAALGPDRVIDYRDEDASDVVRREADSGGVDLILDTVGGDTIERSPYALRPGGRIVSIVDIPQPQSLLEAWNRNAELQFVFTPPRRAARDRLRVLLERGVVRPLVDSVLALEQAPAALARLEDGACAARSRWRRRLREGRGRSAVQG